MYVASSWRSRGDEAKDGWVDATGCIRLFYPNFTVFIVLGYKCSLVISFPINMTQELEERIKYSLVPLPPSSQSCVLRGVVVLHGIRDERRESERFLQFSKEWLDVVAIFSPCKLLIYINTFVCLSKIISYLMLQYFFIFVIFGDIFGPIFDLTI
jgi:hypothetical protein